MRSVLAAVFLLMLVLCAPQGAMAQQLVDLYKVNTLVTSQQAKERNEAASQAMAKLLVRITGDTQIAESAELAGYLRQAQNYVLQFAYNRSSQTLVQADGREVDAFELVFTFSEVAIEKLLRKLQLPIWPENRPSVLVWLVEDLWPEGRAVVTKAEVHEQLRAEALRRGLPLTFPLWDLEDQMAISLDQLWQFRQETLKTASFRYQPNVIVVGRYSRTSSGELRGVWQWLDGENSELLDSRGDNEALLAAPMIDEIANKLAARYAIVPGREANTQLMAHITEVKSFDQYREMLSYLENHEALRSIQLIKAEGESLWIALYPESDLSHLQRAFDLDKKLVPMPSLIAPDGSETNPLIYRWHR
ncbi:DUF2066 domain-containing protein [Simiduia litorea]|uniref:DUF2066 domain-containing protein n=1 Tax=Simiduia litorea TaxID=1435348 RepID=UPI0036F22651